MKTVERGTQQITKKGGTDEMIQKCKQCNWGKILTDLPCRICGGKGFLLNKEKMPVECTGKCTWGAVKYNETCRKCKGKGWHW